MAVSACSAEIPGARHAQVFGPEQRSAPRWRGFRSFLQGGFECATQVSADGRRLDLVAETGHDTSAYADFIQLSAYGIRTCRDGLRWHLIERTPGVYDFTSFEAVARSAREAGTEIIWDLMHFGWPDGLDIWSDEFVTRFAAFAEAAAHAHRSVSMVAPIWCPINEISYLAWAGGHVGVMNPFASGRSDALKQQLVRAAIAAIRALRGVDPRARIVTCEPLIHVCGISGDLAAQAAARGMTGAQWQALDMIVGRTQTHLGGAPDMVDAVGLNYYPFNQWRMTETGAHDGLVPYGHPDHRPLSDLLATAHARYRLPLFLAETGAEGEDRASWFEHVFAQAMTARKRGVPVQGLCLYPIASHVGWCRERFCDNGLLGHWPGQQGRSIHAPLARALERADQQLRQEAESRSA